MIRLKDILLETSRAKSTPPSEYTGDNGNSNKLSLKTVYGVVLDREAAENYKKMIDDMKLDGINVNKVSGFRSYESQYNIVDWEYLESNGKYRTTWDNTVAAAPPGRSNHGWGKAIDVAQAPAAQKWIRDNGVKYGWVWYKKDGGEGESINEPWHFTYSSDKVGSNIQNREVELPNKTSEIVGLQFGDKGVLVKKMQEALLYLDFSVGPRMNDGIFGPYTRQGVTEFQKANNLSATGIYDESTKSALEQKTKQIPQGEIETKIMSLRKTILPTTKKISSNVEYDRDDAKKWSQDVIDALDVAASNYSIPREILYTIANIESGGNSEAKNKKSGAAGLFQIMPQYFIDYGVDKSTVWNPYINAEAATKKMVKRLKSINKIINPADRDNIGAYIYMAHQQGLGGFQTVYTACNKYSNLNAEQALISAAADYNRSPSFGRTVFRNMKANGPDSPCRFINQWIKKYNRNLNKIQKRMR